MKIENGLMRQIALDLGLDVRRSKGQTIPVKNATAAGLNFISFDHPWSSGALYFRSFNYWTAPSWEERKQGISLEGRAFREFFEARGQDIKEIKNVHIIGDLIFPGEYVAWDVVERVFVTLTIEQRIVLARKLKSQYNSSSKQIAKVCGLVYDDVKGLM